MTTSNAALLRAMNIFELRPLITNLNCKLSAVSAYDQRRQLLCLVSEQNDLVLRYTNENGQEVLKLVSWFQRSNRVVHDICFDPTGTWLLVLCFDNTLHIVPALAVVDKAFAETQQTKQSYSINQITSYIIPFVGPHECPNSKNCPNQSSAHNDNNISSSQLANALSQMQLHNSADADVGKATLETFSHDMPTSMLASNAPAQVCEQDKSGNSQVLSNSFMVSKTCPYPLSVVWWQTNEGVNRAIIGYSDASICFVGLSPNCPFVASTSIEHGSVVKLLICKDNTFQSVMLLITSSLKQQYKLLLEQMAIQYTYPGDISPSSAPMRDNDWQIVMPLQTNSNSNSNSSDPASDSSQPASEESAPTAATATTEAITNSNSSPPPQPTTNAPVYMRMANVPPPPPYSVAINRHLDNNSGTTINTTANINSAIAGTSTVNSSGIRFQQQQLPNADLDDLNNRAGIIPAARARLASLKSLGSKKLNAIKMRLSDNRQKMEEYMPESTLGSFAIMDSPSLTPELLTQSSLGSFYTIQNLRSTYLLSALHCHSNSLSVHSIDINLKPLFLYKIPKNCFDILISSNLLYAIQYVNAEEQETAVLPHTAAAENAEKLTTAEIAVAQSELTTEKEQRDTLLEKEEKMTDLSADDDKLLDDMPLNGADSVDTSVTNSAPASSSSNSCDTTSNMINAVSVISSAMASLRSATEDFNATACLGLFRFEHETVLNLYQMCTYRSNENVQVISKEDKAKAFSYKDIHSPMDYVQFFSSASATEKEEYSLHQMEIMQNEFPKINYDPCYVITNKNVYYIQLKKEPFAIFLDAALASEWTQCREFCLTFDLNYETCIEFAGDYLLRRKKITQALLTYNNARIKPIRTALKLAMFGHTNALLHLCAMALKCVYVLRSKYFCSKLIKSMLSDITYRHSEDVRVILPATPESNYGNAVPLPINEGVSCSDYCYGQDESISSLQMSASSQFHLANLMLITLAEKVVNDKNYLPLWNFLVINNKYHTNMTSVVLCQSGLFSSALLLAKVRGVCLDVFLALTSVVAQEFGWYNELNVCLYNLSEQLFIETITYMPQVSIDYFCFIQERLAQIRPCVLERLEQQLNPFSAKLRPIVSHNSTSRLEYCGSNSSNDNNSAIFDFCKNLIETYLAVLIHMESQRSKYGRIKNALSTFLINYEYNQFAIETSRFKPISAGCAYAACVVDGVAYFWGSNGVPCSYSVNKSSEPPEPPHAVKSLDLLAQLNLEVHAVKCGRQHTLVLTNNGLYAFGNNNLYQLGIGNHMQTTLQPMLVSAFDSKNITLLEAGQYHNAAVADGLLYTWGWGVYGQLGHGDAENAEVPKLVAFFKDMKVIQASLGHAHSLVLCQSKNAAGTELYVFGSNHFGQLGLGNNDEMSCASPIKSLLPIKLHVSNAKIRLIHTKFFSNLAVDEDERMYTWGSSPQALRLANQIKRRANSKQKLEELQRREMSKRFEATFAKDDINLKEPSPFSLATTTTTSDAAAATTKTTDAVLSNVMELPNPTIKKTKSIINLVNEQTQEEEQVQLQANVQEDANAQMPLQDDEEEDDDVFTTPIRAEILHNEASHASLKIIGEVVEEIVHKLEPMQAVPLKAATATATTANKTETVLPATQRQVSAETDPSEHMSPHLVDTSEIAGQILQISSGLFHFALISSSCTLYTWGKNLEHQLGTEDRERRAIHKPSAIDSIDRPMYVECGADFTLVMTMDYVVKAFGGNSNGQCGRDLGPSLDKMKQRVVCLPTTKRLMRFESQCVDVPVEINLPRPRIRLDTEPVRYLKSIPTYKAHFVQEADINLQECNYEATASQQYKSSSENVITTTEQELTDDAISSLENLSANDASSLNLSAAGAMSTTNLQPEKSLCDSSCCDESTPEEQSYARLAEMQQQQQPTATDLNKKTNQLLQSTADTLDSATLSNEEELQQLRHYIHYCLYVFHGQYNPDKLREFSKTRLEYRIRTLMLNFKFIEAFQLCLQDCHDAAKTLKLFEYFSKDTSYVPMRRQDLKYFIYHLLRHFLNCKFDVLECERFFLADLDFYLLELAYVLYFNNNNTLLEQNLNQKFKNLIAQESASSLRINASFSSNQNQTSTLNAAAATAAAEQTSSVSKLEDTDVIFDSLSIKFKTIVCQRLLKQCSNN